MVFAFLEAPAFNPDSNRGINERGRESKRESCRNDCDNKGVKNLWRGTGHGAPSHATESCTVSFERGKEIEKDEVKELVDVGLTIW